MAALPRKEPGPSRGEALTVVGLHGITHDFATRGGQSLRAIENVDATAQRHEFVSIIGPSGCGKSTLLRMIAGLITPSAGRCEIYGWPVRQPRDEVGLVFQRPTLLPWLTISGNVLFPARHRHGRVSSRDRERAEQVIRMVGLEDFRNAYPHELSGGMQQRAGIARALFDDPEILLMDEPFSALDALTRDEIVLEFMRLQHLQPKTVIFVTHSIHEAVFMSQRVYVMTRRPGTMRAVHPIALPRERTADTLRSPEFHEHVDFLRGEFAGG